MAAQTDWETDDANLHTPLTDEYAIGNDLTKNNKSGFMAYPSGSRYVDSKVIDLNGSSFCNIGYNALWWSSTESEAHKTAYVSVLYNWSKELYSMVDDEEDGHSIRLLKN